MHYRIIDSVFAAGTLLGPAYLPPWMKRTSALASYLAFSVFTNQIAVETLGANFEFTRHDGG
jgi:hypothetical protein